MTLTAKRSDGSVDRFDQNALLGEAARSETSQQTDRWESITEELWEGQEQGRISMDGYLYGEVGTRLPGSLQNGGSQSRAGDGMTRRRGQQIGKMVRERKGAGSETHLFA